MSEIGKNIKELRVKSGMSQERLAEKIGKTRSAISQYESGTIIPRMGTIEDVAQVFHVDKRSIIGDGSVTYAIVNLDEADEQRILELYRSLDDDTKKLVLDLLERLAK